MSSKKAIYALRDMETRNSCIFKENKRLVEFLRDNRRGCDNYDMTNVNMISDDHRFMSSQTCQKILHCFYRSPVHLTICYMYEHNDPLLVRMKTEGIGVEYIKSAKQDKETHDDLLREIESD